MEVKIKRENKRGYELVELKTLDELKSLVESLANSLTDNYMMITIKIDEDGHLTIEQDYYC